MLIELSKGDIMINKNPHLKDFKLNIAPNHQMRCKFIAITSNKDIPLDFVVYNWSFKLNIKTISIIITAMEMNSKKNIQLTLSYNILRRYWHLNGIIDKNNINMNIKSLYRISELFIDIFLK